MLAGLICACAADSAFGQAGSMFGSRGPTSQSAAPVGRSGSRTSSGQSMFGSSALESVGTSTTDPSQGGRTNGQQQEFIGRNSANDRFVGSQASGQGSGRTTNRTTNRSSRTTTRRNNNQNGFNMQNFQNADRNRGSSRSRVAIRPQQRIAFSYPQPSAAGISTALQSRFDRVADRQASLAEIAITTEADGVVVLKGEVASEDSKRLAAMIARLEPGVRSVRNELTVRAAVQ
jgi:hypothetical protein